MNEYMNGFMSEWIYG